MGGMSYLANILFEVEDEVIELVYKYNQGTLFAPDGNLRDEDKLLLELDAHWHKLKGRSLPQDVKILEIKGEFV